MRRALIIVLAAGGILVLLLAVLLLTAAREAALPAGSAAFAPQPWEEEDSRERSSAPAPSAPPPSAESKKKEKGSSAPREGRGAGQAVAEQTEAEGAPTRSWFPETFLFEPLVLTDEQGRATIPVRVPDRLTHWRILALAHSRDGNQAGAVASFAGTLPAYVDLVVPPFLTAGDELRLPIQLVNTTATALSTRLALTAAGAQLSSAGGPVQLPAGGSQVQYVTLKADLPGRIAVKATLGATDAVERTFEVRPAGQPISVSKGGTLAAPRTFFLEGPSHPIPDSERVRLLVFPGALALLRSELAAAPHRYGAAEDAYALLLSGRAADLLRSLGEEADLAAIRTMSLQVTQRAIRHGRAPDVPAATLLAEAALSHEGSPVLGRLGERLAATVASRQRPDGTCQGEDGWTLQRVLVASADCARAVGAAQTTAQGRQRAILSRSRAAGAFERNARYIEDGYTAAAILASGAVSGPLAGSLREKVRQALRAHEDGSGYLPVEPGVVRADGIVPSEVEATALAVLALEQDASGQVVDLGTTLLAHYSPASGWGDGQANLVCLRAVLALFKDPVPTGVRIVLERDGTVVTQGRLDPSKLKDVLALEAAAPGGAGRRSWTVRAEPSVAGLGFALTVLAHVPWKAEPSQGGLQLAIEAPQAGRVGQIAAVGLLAAAPAGMALRIRHALPAGVQPELASLEALVGSGVVSRYETEAGAVVLHVPPRSAGHPFIARYQVVPTLAGTLQAGASTLFVPGRPELSRQFPPTRWVIR